MSTQYDVTIELEGHSGLSVVLDPTQLRRLCEAPVPFSDEAQDPCLRFWDADNVGYVVSREKIIFVQFEEVPPEDDYDDD